MKTMYIESWYEKFERIGDQVAEALTPLAVGFTLVYLAVRIIEAFGGR